MECQAQCPYCWETVEVWVDPGGSTEQRYVEDCSVCCRPWQVVAWIDEELGAQVTLLRLDD